jgi:hypothetical protein
MAAEKPDHTTEYSTHFKNPGSLFVKPPDSFPYHKKAAKANYLKFS